MTTLQAIVGFTVQSASEQLTIGGLEANQSGWFNLRDLSEATGLSRPTCRKYIRILVDAGLVKQVWYGGTSTAIYYWIGE